jgi:hypothetical protein
MFLREERSTTQEKPAIADNSCYATLFYLKSLIFTLLVISFSSE